MKKQIGFGVLTTAGLALTGYAPSAFAGCGGKAGCGAKTGEKPTVAESAKKDVPATPEPAKKETPAKDAAAEAKKPEGLSDDEWDLVQKFRKMPEGNRPMIMQMIDRMANMDMGQMMQGRQGGQMPQGGQRQMRQAGGQRQMQKPAPAPKDAEQEEKK